MGVNGASFHPVTKMFLEKKMSLAFGTKKKWPHKTGDLLKEVKFI
jgi:hypothetical protein